MFATHTIIFGVVTSHKHVLPCVIVLVSYPSGVQSGSLPPAEGATVFYRRVRTADERLCGYILVYVLQLLKDK